mgnify:CR=1 FL=1
MKRYQKKRFACGIACLILAVICGSVMAAEGVSVKLAVSALLLTALGGGDLLLSMDKTIQMPRPDERDRQVVQTSAWRAYRILVHGCLAAGIILAAVRGMADAGAAGSPDNGMAGGAGVLWNSAGMQPLL